VSFLGVPPKLTKMGFTLKEKATGVNARTSALWTEEEFLSAQMVLSFFHHFLSTDTLTVALKRALTGALSGAISAA